MEISHPYSIVLVVSHVYSMNATGSSHYSGAAVFDTYSRLKFIAVHLKIPMNDDQLYRDPDYPWDAYLQS